MKVLLLGGTGAMGAHLSALLSERGDDVAVTTRSKKQDVTAVKYITGNAHDDSFLDKVLAERWDVIVDFMVYSTEVFESRIQKLLNASAQYIYLSSARVYAESSQPLTENSPRLLYTTSDKQYLETDEYALTKARQENILFDSKNKNWTIIRPYITYSEQRLQLGVLEKEAWLYRALNKRPIAFSKDINEKTTTVTYGLDVAKGIASIIGHENALGEAFHITTDESIKWQQVLEVYSTVLEEHLKVSPTILLQEMKDFVTHHSAVHQIKYDRLFNRQFDNSKINQFIDTSTFLSPVDGLKSCLKTFLIAPHFLSINWAKEAIKDKQQGVFATFSELPSLKKKARYMYYRFK